MSPAVNIEETIGKTVGRRRIGDSLAVPRGDRERKREMQKAGFFPRIPRGVYRFKTFEEADEWMMKAMTRDRLKS